MNRSDLIKKMSENADSLNVEDLEQTVKTILNLISNYLDKGDRVEIRNFGSFSTRKRQSRISRNPKTGTSVLVEAKNHPYFRCNTADRCWQN